MPLVQIAFNVIDGRGIIRASSRSAAASLAVEKAGVAEGSYLLMLAGDCRLVVGTVRDRSASVSKAKN